MEHDEYIERVKSLLHLIIESKIDLVLATRQLRQLYYEEENSVIPIEMGVGYESEQDDVPIPAEYYQWSKSGLEERLKKIELYRDYIIADAKDLLNQLNSSK